MPAVARCSLLFLCLTAVGFLQSSLARAETWWIDNVQIIDGTGAPAFDGAVKVVDDHIAGVSRDGPMGDATVVDGGGMTLAPGFIDTHSHADEGLNQQRDALQVISQGITTIVVGQDGDSPSPLNNWFGQRESAPATVNVAAYSGHNTLRQSVMGEDANGPSSIPQVEAMSELLQQDLDAGALGLATGLEYEPGIYSETEEVLALAHITAAAGGRYISHLRSEDRWFFEAIEEIIRIGSEVGIPVQISHLKLAMKSHWGKAAELLARLDAARAQGVDITADIYPYTYWQSNMMVLIPSRDLKRRSEFEFALQEIAPPDGFWLTHFAPEPDYVGMTLTQIAASRDEDPVDTYMRLAADSEAWKQENGSDGDSMIGTSMIEGDIETLLQWAHTNVCSDGGLVDGHPRGAGAFPRVLGRYVRERGVLDLETAIHKMTGRSAQHMGITDRGRIYPGQAADLVLFDPATIIDQATPQSPGTLSTGIHQVWVNGETVFRDGEATALRPGRVIRRNGVSASSAASAP